MARGVPEGEGRLQGSRACPGVDPAPRGKGQALHPGLTSVFSTADSNPSSAPNEP